MSRVGKQELHIANGTEVSLTDGVITVKGPKGTLSRTLRPEVEVKIENGMVTVSPTADTIFARALWGTTASHIKNMLSGVVTPFEKKLILEGVGYRCELKGRELVLNVGFSHQVILPLPDGIDMEVVKNEMTVRGIDKEAVGQFAANIRKTKKPEPYKGKGIRYDGEVILRKQGKKSA
jgi:ribosomal protein L6, bacterial type